MGPFSVQYSLISWLYHTLRRDKFHAYTIGYFPQSLHTAVPHFAEKTDQGVYQQQDAHECWSTIFSNLSEALQVPMFLLVFDFFVSMYKSVKVYGKIFW